MNLDKLTRTLYKAARVSNTLRAASRGPKALAKRQVRKVAYRATGRTLGRVLKRGGLG